MPVPKNKSENKYDKSSTKIKIFKTLKKWILKGQLKPLEKLDDKEIAKYFSVSRTPVREAFQLLETKKLIKSSPGKSTRVTEIDVNNINEIYLPLISLQCLALTSGIENITGTDLDKLKEINNHFHEAIDRKDTDSILQKDLDFHKHLINLSNNAYIIEFCDTLMDHTYRLEYLFFEHTPDLKESFREHEEIINALERKDAYSSSLLMKQHWNRTVLLVKTLIEEGIN
ncbi:GntR family transcriptional regulator [Niallia sp. 03133]|uniref:GntR family transcriptional regulator n=1 Tax=Niallia sp. 03133 TaxID=3458060 RepID=UPI004044F512